jgi:hypothetical protein
MMYTEFVVKPTSVDAAAANLNGGSGGTPIAFGGCGADGAGHILGGAPFTGIVAGDWFTWDTGGMKRRGRVVSNDGMVGMFQQLTVVPTDGGGAILSPGVPGVNVIFRGAWADPSTVAGLTTASVNAAGNPPRLNVLASDGAGNQIVYPFALTVVNSGTAAIPITVEGYRTAYGDLRGAMTAPLLRLNSGISTAALLQVNGSHIVLRNLCVSTTQSGTHGIELNGVNNCQVVNCTVATGNLGIHLYGGSCHLVDTCLVTACNQGIYVHGSTTAVILNSRMASLNSGAIGVNVFNASMPLVKACLVNNFNGDGIVWYGPFGLTVLDCTFHTLANNAINAGAMTDLSSLAVEGCIFTAITGSVLYSTAGGNLYPARYAHNIEYANGGRFSANVLDNSEDIAAGNPFVSGGEVLSAAAKQHAILLADGYTSTYPDLGAVQAQAAAPGGLLVNNAMTGGMT